MLKSNSLFLFIILFSACNALKKESSVKTKAKDDSKQTAVQPKEPVSVSNPVVIVGGPDTMKTASGLRYLIFRHKGGSVRPKYADKVSVHYRGLLADGTVFGDSYKTGEPFEFQLGMKKVIRGWDEGIALLAQGDSALLIVPPSLGYGATEKGGVPANSTLYFYIELMKVKEPVFANEYAWQNKEPHLTASGLKYYIIKEGNGRQAYQGATVKLNYTGYLENGKIFESTVISEDPIEFKVGSSLKGLNEGMLLMRQGAKYRFVIPPALGYGDVSAGDGRIPANSTLIFDCELMEVK